MDIWQILELQPTPDQKAIKRAYAKKLKVTRPDENPQEFQNLHMAYKAALEQALYWEEEQEEWESEENNNGHYQQESLALETSVTQQQENLLEKNPALEIQQIDPHAIEVQQTATPEYTHRPEPVIPETSNVEPEQTEEINPYQVEGERLLALAEDLFSKQHSPAKARSWEFIIESPFILEDQFNWQLGLELLRAINKHNLSPTTQNISMVKQQALSYLNSIFNWTDNRHHVIRALGTEYHTWLDMIQENDPDEKDYRNQIRGGKKLSLQQKNNPAQIPQTTPKSSLGFTRFCAFIIDCIVLTFLIIMLASGETSDHQSISNKAIGVLSILAVFIYFCGFEASMLQGTPGKKIMKLAIITDQGEPPEFLHALFRTFCFFVFYILFSAIPAGLQILAKSYDIDFPFLSIAIQGYAIYLASRPVTIYDKISKTRVIQI